MKQREKKMEMAIEGVRGAEKDAVRRTAAFAMSCGFSEARIEDIKTSLEEACLNSIEHGVPDSADQSVRIRLTFEDRILQVEVWDGGKSFAVSDRTPDLAAKIEGTEPARGWGVYLIRTLADGVEFESKPGNNSVRMRFVLKPDRDNNSGM